MFGVCGDLKYRKQINMWRISTGNCTFNPETLVADSFSWWNFVYTIKGKLVFNDWCYSGTTTSHQNAVRRLLGELKIKIDYTVSVECSLEYFKDRALEPEYEKLFQVEIELANSRSMKRLKEYRRNQIKEIQKTIKQYRQLGAVFSKNKQKELKTKLIEQEKSRLENLKNDESVRKPKINKELLADAKTEMSDLGPVILKFKEQSDLKSVKF